MSAGVGLRFRYVCGQYGRLLVAALVVLSAVAFAGAAAGVTDTTEPRRTTVQTDQQAVQTSLAATATVTGNTTLYERGETVTDVPVYLLGATPNLTLRATADVPADRTVSVTQNVVLELAATRNDEVFWTERRELTSASQVTTNGSARTAVTLDVRRLARERLTAVRAATDDVGTVRTRILVNTSYDTGTYAGHTTLASPLSIADRAYEFDTPRTAQQNHSRSVTRTANASVDEAGVAIPGTGSSVPGRSLLWAIVGLGALGVAVFVRSVDRGIADFETFERRYERVRYAEWISRGTIPDTGSYLRVPVETLVDLVDIAIDSEKRVVHDESRDMYAVVDGNIMYEFRPDETPGRMYEFGLGPIEGTDATLDEERQQAEAAASNGDDAPEFEW